MGRSIFVGWGNFSIFVNLCIALSDFCITSSSFRWLLLFSPWFGGILLYFFWFELLYLLLLLLCIKRFHALYWCFFLRLHFIILLFLRENNTFWEWVFSIRKALFDRVPQTTILIFALLWHSFWHFGQKVNDKKLMLTQIIKHRFIKLNKTFTRV